MMVGVVISLLTVAALLVLYKAMIDESGQASRSALRDGQAAASLLAAQLDVQSAGFGLSDGNGLDIVDWDESGKLVYASGNRGPGNTVLWRYKATADVSNTDFLCSGLHLVVAPGREGLYRLPERNCASGFGWEAVDLQPVALDNRLEGEGDIGDFEVVFSSGYQFRMDDNGGAGFQCLPYMQQDDDSTLPGVVKLLMERRDGSATLFSACLSNLVVGA